MCVILSPATEKARRSCPTFLDLQKAYDWVPRVELWYCMRKSGAVEKYVRVSQEDSVTEVRCAVGVTSDFRVDIRDQLGAPFCLYW